METILSISHKILDTLTAEAAVKQFRNLLWCEARSNRLPLHKIVVSLDTTVSDGGIDAKVEGDPKADSLLVHGNCYFQIKTGKSFKPWQISSLKKELLGKTKIKPAKALLGNGVKTCLNNNGKYVVIAFGSDLTAQQHSQALQHLDGIFRDCGYKKPAVDILGQGQLISLLSKYPSLCLELLGKADYAFQTVDSWKTNEDMTSSLQLADAQKKFIEDLRAVIRGSEYQHVRVIGEPGIGKTRLILEALSQDDISPCAIYLPLAEDFQKSQLFNDLLRPDRQYDAILVLDDCAEKDRASIWHAIKGKQNIKLITIDHGPERSSDSSMKVMDCPILPDEQIGKIIAGYVGDRNDVSNWMKWCSGSPRVAHAVGDNLKRNPSDLLKPPATVPIWDRFILGHKKVDSKEAEQHLLVLRHIALFQRFGFDAPVDDEARFISELVREADSSITWARFQTIVKYHKGRRILQGNRTLFLIPKALHVHLWLGYWEHYGRGFNFQSFFAKVPPDLRKWFLELFIYAHAAPVAGRLVEQILEPKSGPFSDETFLVSESGTRFLNYLAEADPAATLALLEATYGQWPLDKLRGWETGRQNIVWALEKISVWKSTFSRSARLLVRMALAENAKNSNNSKGMLLNLFLIGLGWAPTEASPDQRLPVIEELLRVSDSSMRELGLELCERWLSTYGGSRIVGAEYQGLRPTAEFWRPKTYGEVYDSWRKVWNLLCQESHGWADSDRRKANSTIIKAAAGLISIPAVSEKVMATLLDIATDPATDKAELLHFVIHRQKYQAEKLHEDIIAGLREIDRLLTGVTFWERFNRFVLMTNYDEDYIFEGEQLLERDAPKKRVSELVLEIVKHPEMLKELLPRFVGSRGHRLYQFGYELSLALNDGALDRQVIATHESVLPEITTQFSGGYFAGVKQRDKEAWETAVIEMLESDTLRRIGIEVFQLSGASDRIIGKLMQVYKDGKITSAAFNRIGFSADREAISQNLVEDLLNLLIDQPDERSVSVATEIADQYFFRDNDNKRIIPERLLYHIIVSPDNFVKDSATMQDFYWGRLAKVFIDRHPGRRLELFAVIMDNMHNISSFRKTSQPSQIADSIAHALPAEAWGMVISHIERDDENGYYVLNWLSADISFDEEVEGNAIRYFDPETVMGWIAEKPEKRIGLIERCLPKTLDSEDGGLLTQMFIDKYFDNGNIARGLISYFIWSGGWSGPESAYLMSKRDKARKWVSEIRSEKTQVWLSMYIDVLTKGISKAEIDEERRF